MKSILRCKVFNPTTLDQINKASLQSTYTRHELEKKSVSMSSEYVTWSCQLLDLSICHDHALEEWGKHSQPFIRDYHQFCKRRGTCHIRLGTLLVELHPVGCLNHGH